MSHGLIQKTRPAFTMIEMLAAMAITLIMVLFLSQIFSTVSSTVAAGVATSDIIQSNLAFTQQLERDSQSMVGSSGGGFMVVFSKRIPGVQLRPEDPATADIHCDQIAWVRDRGSLQPLTPSAITSYAAGTSTATHGRVWYGHVVRTDATGISATDLGVAGPNAIGARWILGRQVWFLDSAPAGVYINSTLGYPSWYVAGYTSDPAAPDELWYSGLSDIFDQDLSAITNDFLFTSGYPQGPYRFAYGTNRLWCNPQPQPTSGDLTSWQMAQTHPYFIGNISDFQIDMAGDWNGLAPGIDTNLIDGGIIWYNHYYNNPTEGQRGGGAYDANLPLLSKPPLAPLIPSGFLPPAVVSVLPLPYYDEASPLPNADGAFVFRPLGLAWPKMLRLRYRIHDKQAKFTDRDGGSGKLFERIVKVAQ